MIQEPGTADGRKIVEPSDQGGSLVYSAAPLIIVLEPTKTLLNHHLTSVKVQHTAIQPHLLLLQLLRTCSPLDTCNACA